MCIPLCKGKDEEKEMGLMEVSDLSCSAQMLRLIINDGLSSHRVVMDILAKLTVIQEEVSSVHRLAWRLEL